MNLNDLRNIYFIGIGGIGMSALARYFKGRGLVVSGYDKTETPLTKALVAEGIAVHYTEDIAQIPQGVDLVVYTPAVPADHKELLHFQAQGLPVKKRAEVLGIISRGMKTIAVAGTHGKTTTSTMVAHLLHSGGVECAAFLGGISLNFGTNFIHSNGEWVVVEADEYDRSFLQLDPDLAIVTSVEADHLDIYGDHEQLIETGYRAFAKKLKPGGKLWANVVCESYFEDLKGTDSYGVDGGNYRSENIRMENGRVTFDFTCPQLSMKGAQLGVPGRHNVENATAAIAVALEAGASPQGILAGLASFRGTRRRFEVVWRSDDLVYVDDYAHHPTELEATIGAARMYFPGKKLTGIFQPHLYSRTRDFAQEFAQALDQLDEVLLLDIYPARELPIAGVSSEMVFELMQNPNKRLVSKTNLLAALAATETDVLLTMGAGDIDTFTAPIAEALEKRFSNLSI